LHAEFVVKIADLKFLRPESFVGCQWIYTHGCTHAMELTTKQRLSPDGFAMMQRELFQTCAKVLHLFLGRFQLHFLDRATYVQVLCARRGLVLQPLYAWTTTHGRTRTSGWNAPIACTRRATRPCRAASQPNTLVEDGNQGGSSPRNTHSHRKGVLQRMQTVDRKEEHWKETNLIMDKTGSVLDRRKVKKKQLHRLPVTRAGIGSHMHSSKR